MKLRKIINALLIIIPIMVFIVACKKTDGLGFDSTENHDEIELVKSAKIMSTSCSGSETNTVSYDMESNPDYFSRVKITKVRSYFCDGVPIGSSSKVILDDYYQGSAPDPEPDNLVIFEPNYYNPIYTECNGAYFNVRNIIHYNTTYFEGRPLDAGMLGAIFTAVSSFPYGTYNMDDFDMLYGEGSREKLIYAVFGYFSAEAFGTSKFTTWVQNVPSVSGWGGCDQIRFKGVCMTGSSGYSNYYSSLTSYQDVFDYYAAEIASHRM